MAERANEWMNKWGAMLIQVSLFAVLVPWGWGINSAIKQLMSDMQDNRAWHNTHLQIEEKDKDILKRELTAEMEKMIRTLLEKYDSKIDGIQSSLRATDQAVRDASARIQVTGDQVSAVSAQLARTTALLQQALVDNDFKRNEADKKGP